MIKDAHGEHIRRAEGLKGQQRGNRERRKTLNVDEEALKCNDKVLLDNEKALKGNRKAY